MKRFLITSILATIVAAGTALMAQDYPDEYLGLPGDNLNLYAVMKLFQESETLEGFERSLNDENSRINNLDLNGDNYIDYLKVVDYVDGDAHNIVLQAVLDRNETQDVAVFTVQRFRDGSVQIQLTGDEALYGRNYIIEPIFDETPNPGYLGRSRNNGTIVRTTTVQIAMWPLVRFIYMPGYTVWHSSWYWGYYPTYWHPWRPYYWHYYYGYHYHWFPEYYSHYRHWDNHRYSHWNDFYYNGRRTYSRNVSMRINSGDYRTTYSRPDSRRDGEALFIKSHPDRPTRSSVASSGNNNGRRSVSGSTDTRQSTGTTVNGSRRSTSASTVRTETTRSSGQYSGNSRRSSTSTTGNDRGNSSTRQNNGAVPRSTTTVNNRANSDSRASQSTVSNRRSSSTVNRNSNPGSSSGQGTSRQSSTNVNERTRTNSPAGQSAGSSRRSSSGSSGQSVSRPSSGQGNASSGQSNQTARSSRQSSSSAGSSARRSSETSKSTKSSKDSGTSKNSENTTSRRK